MIASSQNPFRWDDARVLLALHRGRTLTAAAASLGVEPSTVGRRIDALEEALGARLFERTPDGAIPTLAAEELVPHAEAMESAAYALAGRAEGFERHVEGTVRLSVPPGIADLMIAPALPALLARHPELRVELDARIAYVDLARREADLVLRGLRPERGDLVAARLVEAESIPFVSRSAPLTKVRAPESLPWITYGEDLAHIPDARWVLGVAAPSRLVLRTNSYTSQIAAAEAGVGCVLVARELGQERPGLRPVAFTPAAKKKLPPFPRGSLWLVAHRSARHVPRVAAVWDFLVDRFRAC